MAIQRHSGETTLINSIYYLYLFRKERRRREEDLHRKLTLPPAAVSGEWWAKFI